MRLNDEAAPLARPHRYSMSDFKKLKVWQKAHDMSLLANTIAKTIRAAYERELRSQLKRSSASVPANIVEGRAQKSEREFARFLGYAVASCSETEYHAVSARDKGLISEAKWHALTTGVVEVRKMLHGLIDKLNGDK
jgi:four helix bundle protein